MRENYIPRRQYVGRSVRRETRRSGRRVQDAGHDCGGWGLCGSAFMCPTSLRVYTCVPLSRIAVRAHPDEPADVRSAKRSGTGSSAILATFGPDDPEFSFGPPGRSLCPRRSIRLTRSGLRGRRNLPRGARDAIGCLPTLHLDRGETLPDRVRKEITRSPPTAVGDGRCRID